MFFCLSTSTQYFWCVVIGKLRIKAIKTTAMNTITYHSGFLNQYKGGEDIDGASIEALAIVLMMDNSRLVVEYKEKSSMYVCEIV